jgi:hypothetical protein
MLPSTMFQKSPIFNAGKGGNAPAMLLDNHVIHVHLCDARLALVHRAHTGCAMVKWLAMASAPPFRGLHWCSSRTWLSNPQRSTVLRDLLGRGALDMSGTARRRYVILPQLCI